MRDNDHGDGKGGGGINEEMDKERMKSERENGGVNERGKRVEDREGGEREVREERRKGGEGREGPGRGTVRGLWEGRRGEVKVDE